MFEYDREQSEFNSNVTFLNSLNYSFMAAKEASTALDMVAWYHHLMSIIRDLSEAMKPEEQERIEAEMEAINNQLPNAIRRDQRTGKTSVDHNVYLRLHCAEKELRRVQMKAGLLYSRTSDPGHALR